MNETTTTTTSSSNSSQPGSAVAVAIAPDPDRQLQRNLSVGQFVIAIIVLSGSVAGGVFTGISSFKGEQAELRQVAALTEMRLKILEAEAQANRNQMEVRNDLLHSVKADISSIKTSITNLEERNRENRK